MDRSAKKEALLDESWSTAWLNDSIFPYWPEAAHIGNLQQFMGWLAVQDEERAALVARHAREFERVHRLITAEFTRSDSASASIRKRNSHRGQEALQYGRIATASLPATLDSTLLHHNVRKKEYISNTKGGGRYHPRLARSLSAIDASSGLRSNQRRSAEDHPSVLVYDETRSWPPSNNTRRITQVQRDTFFALGVSRMDPSPRRTSISAMTRSSRSSLDHMTERNRATDRDRTRLRVETILSASDEGRSRITKEQPVRDMPIRVSRKSHGATDKKAVWGVPREAGLQGKNERGSPLLSTVGAGVDYCSRPLIMPGAGKDAQSFASKGSGDEDDARPVIGGGTIKRFSTRKDTPMIEDFVVNSLPRTWPRDVATAVQDHASVAPPIPCTASSPPRARCEIYETKKIEVNKRNRGLAQRNAREDEWVFSRQEGRDVNEDKEENVERNGEIGVREEPSEKLKEEKLEMSWARHGETWLRMRDPVSQRYFWFDPETRAAEWEDGRAMDTPEGMGLGLLSKEARDSLERKFQRRQQRRRKGLRSTGLQQPDLREQVLRKLTLEGNQVVGVVS